MTTPMALSCCSLSPNTASTIAATTAPATAPKPTPTPHSSAAAAPISANSLVACTEKDIWRSTISGVITPLSRPNTAEATSAWRTKSTDRR